MEPKIENICGQLCVQIKKNEYIPVEEYHKRKNLNNKQNRINNNINNNSNNSDNNINNINTNYNNIINNVNINDNINNNINEDDNYLLKIKKNIIKIVEDSESINSNEIKFTKEVLCILCYTNPAKIILVPCGHNCLCRDCFENIKSQINAAQYVVKI